MKERAGSNGLNINQKWLVFFLTAKTDVHSVQEGSS